MEIRFKDFGWWVGCFYGGAESCKRKCVREGGMTGCQLEETITCIRLGSSSALSFIFCCHRSREKLPLGVCTLFQCSKDVACMLTKTTSFTDGMTLCLFFTSRLCDTAGFLQFKLSLFAVAALQVLLHDALPGCWSNHTAYISSPIKEINQRLYGSNWLMAKYQYMEDIIDLNELCYSISIYLCFD